MRIGALLDENWIEDPCEWAAHYVKHGLRAADFPHKAPYTAKDTKELRGLRDAFEKNDIVFGEVAAWRNPFDPDPEKAKENIDHIIDRLAVADEIGACCAAMMVGNLCTETGHIGAANMSEEFYERSVEMTRRIVDEARPKRAKLGFEIFPFNFLDSTDMYVRFLTDIDRPQVTAHLDAINLINCPRLYIQNARVMRDAVKRLAPFGIAALHLKDLLLHGNQPNTYLEEVPIGQGGLDLGALLKAVDEYLPEDTAVLMEHLPDAQYDEVLPIAVDMARRAGVTRF